MATERARWAMIALLAAGCAGGAEEPAADPAADAEGSPAAPAAAAAPGQAGALPARVLAEIDTVIQREVFSYSGGTRDPFLPLLGTESAGPEITDLELAAIYYVGGNAGLTTAVLREKVSGRRHTVRAGQRVGRMYVASISEQDVWFTIDDFGVQRRESLTLRKQEDDIR